MKEDGDGGEGGGGGGATAVKVENQRVPFYKLFSFADRLDVILMIVGTISAMGNGLAQPLMTLIFGQLINSFGSSNPSNVVKEVSKVCMPFFAMSRRYFLLGVLLFLGLYVMFHILSKCKMILFFGQPIFSPKFSHHT